MSRRRKAQIREVLPDPVHNSTVLTKFTNAIMLNGKKAVAESLINRSFTDIQSKTGESPISIFSKAIDNVKPPKVSKSFIGFSHFMCIFSFFY